MQLNRFIDVTHFGMQILNCVFIQGAQIIDLMVLVVDVMKGVQTQTAECLIIGEIICNKMLVVLNKIDLIPENKREVLFYRWLN